MKTQDPEPYWRSLTVDALIGATLLSVVFATGAAAVGLNYVLPIAVSILLVGTGWALESHAGSLLTGPFPWSQWRHGSAAGMSMQAEQKDISASDAIRLVGMPPC